MNALQRKTYFRLWAAAAVRQGFDVRDEARRRAVTLEATGAESTTALDQDGITRLFAHLRWLADPDDLDKARALACPEDSAEADRARRLVWVITHELMTGRDGTDPAQPARPAFADAYVQRCAAGLLKNAVVIHWMDLPAKALGKLLFTLTQRRQQQGADYQPRQDPYHRREKVRAKRAAEREPQVVPRPAVAAALAAQETDAFPF